MARKTKQASQLTCAQVLDAASWCFRTQGIYRTTISAIANRAGVSRGAVYWHFQNKEQLLAAVLDRGHVPILERLMGVTRASAPVLPALRACMVQLALDVQSTPHMREALEIVFRHGDFAGECMPPWPPQQEMIGRTNAVLRVVFARAALAGELPIAASHQAALLTGFAFFQTLRNCVIADARTVSRPSSIEGLDLLFAWISAHIRGAEAD